MNVKSAKFDIIGILVRILNMKKAALLLSLIGSVAATPDIDLTIYKCSLCETIIGKMIEHGTTFPEACDSLFDKVDKICDAFHEYLPDGVGTDPRATCMTAGFCPGDAGWYPPIDNSKLDIRVSKAHGGNHGYDKVRISVVSNATITDPLFTYSAPFKYRWTDMVLNTGIATVTPGVDTSFTIAGEEFNIFVPAENAGTRGIIVGDPCFMSKFVECEFANTWNMFNNTVKLIDAASAHGSDLGYWMVLGDNFYDQKGEATRSFFSALSYNAKTTLFGTTPGNHDFWVHSSPSVYVPADQLGHGFMQYYGQDTAAATADAPFDFSVDPDEVSLLKGRKHALPAADNFFSYYKIGDTGFITFSGAHAYEDMKPEFVKACNWAAAEGPEYILLQSHWNEEGYGCEGAMTTPAVYAEMAALPECSSVLPKMKYFMGHEHCNTITEPGLGYMVGAQGMGGCGEWGIPIVDTTSGSFKVYYFLLYIQPGPMNSATEAVDNFEAVYSCFRDNGVSNCYHLATEWA